MTIALFLTEKTSFAVWERAGFLARGVTAYNRLASFCEHFYFVSYGDMSELHYQPLFAKNAIILFKRHAWMPLRLYGLISPFIHARALRTVDVFYSGQMQGAWSAVIAKVVFRKKLVLNCGYQWSLFARKGGAGYAKQWCIGIIEWITYHCADHIIVSSVSARERVIQRYHISPRCVDVIPNYVDTALFRPLDLPRKPRSLIFVGRLEPQKNLFALFDSLTDTNIHVTVVGTGSLETALKEYARARGIQVTFLTVIPNDELPYELNRHCVFVLPSLYEGSPKALFEAMACGMPVLAADSPGIREVITYGVNGFLCAPTAHALHAAIAEIFNNFDFSLEVGGRARRFIMDTCDLNRKIAREMEIFNAVCHAV